MQFSLLKIINLYKKFMYSKLPKQTQFCFIKEPTTGLSQKDFGSLSSRWLKEGLPCADEFVTQHLDRLLGRIPRFSVRQGNFFMVPRQQYGVVPMDHQKGSGFIAIIIYFKILCIGSCRGQNKTKKSYFYQVIHQIEYITSI